MTNMSNPTIEKIEDLIEEGDFGRAVDLCEEVLKSSQDQWLVFALRGNAQFKLGHLEEALSDFQASIERNPKNSTTYFFRAKTFAALGDNRNAISDYSRSIELSPKADSIYNRGLAYACEGDISMAIEDFERLEKIEPLDFETLQYAASLSAKKKDFKKAKSFLLKSIVLKDQDADTYYNLGVFSEELGELDAAKSCYQKCIQLDPSIDDAKFNLNRLVHQEKSK